MKRKLCTEGFTLVELLLAMAILTVALALVFIVLNQGVDMQQRTERDVSLDTSLRRVSQIVAQDIRNSPYGVLTSVPYPSTATSFSVFKATDSAVQAVVGPTTNFRNSTAVSILTPNGFNWPSNTSFLLINPAQANTTLLKTSAAVTGSGTVNLPHGTQINTVCQTANSIVQRGIPIGVQYNAAQRILYRQVQRPDATETVPLAYGMTAFIVTYIGTNGSSYSALNTLLSAGTQLDRMELNFTMARRNGSAEQVRSLSTTVEVPKLFTLTSSPLKFVLANTTLTC